MTGSASECVFVSVWVQRLTRVRACVKSCVHLLPDVRQ